MRDDPDRSFAPAAGAPADEGPHFEGDLVFRELIADLEGPTAKVVPELWIPPRGPELPRRALIDDLVDEDDPTVAVPGVCSVLARQLLLPPVPRRPSARRVIVAPLGPPRPPPSTRPIVAKIDLARGAPVRPATPVPPPPTTTRWRFTIALVSAILSLGGLAWYLGSLPD